MMQAIGLMSGTSMDGIDAAIIKTDGKKVEDTGYFWTENYDPELRARVRGITKSDSVLKLDLAKVERDITIAHAEVVNKLLEKYGIDKSEIDIIGFHGQTISHFPNEGITWQIGNGAMLAEKTGINVMCDFRRRDVAAGGEGAPLVPLYHAAIVNKFKEPIAILNIGGSANLTYIAKREKKAGLDIIGFDTGPGNSLLDDWVHRNSGKNFDENGDFAASGKINKKLLDQVLSDPYFAKVPPKSLDREYFSQLIYNLFETGEKISLEDGAATLAAITAKAVVKASAFLPSKPAKWFVCGGGRKNNAIMAMLAKNLKGKVEKIEALGFNGDVLEAQAFGFLAVRAFYGMNLSLPETTGVKRLVTGGAFYRA